MLQLPGGNFCNYECATQYGKEKGLKKIEKDRKEKHKQLKKKVKDNDRSHWTKKAQSEFNKFIRIRDKNDPCISCGRFHSGQYHAGHYRTVGANPELRFNPNNCHKQCSACNNHLSGNLVNYRIGLISKMGIKEVENLEAFHPQKRYTIENLKTIYRWYRRKNRRLENAKDSIL